MVESNISQSGNTRKWKIVLYISLFFFMLCALFLIIWAVIDYTKRNKFDKSRSIPNGTGCRVDTACVSGKCGLSGVIKICCEQTNGAGACLELPDTFPCSFNEQCASGDCKSTCIVCGNCPTGQKCGYAGSVNGKTCCAVVGSDDKCRGLAVGARCMDNFQCGSNKCVDGICVV